MAGFEELAVHAGRDLGAGLHTEVVAEKDDVDIGTDQAEVLFQVFQVPLGQAFEKVVGPLRFGGQKGQEVVVPVQELPVFHEVAAEEADYRPVGAFPQAAGACDHTVVAARAFYKGAGGGGDVPHALGHHLLQSSMVRLALSEGKVGRLEVQRAVGHLGDDPASRRTYDPTPLGPFRGDPHRHLAGGPIGKGPVRPVRVVQGKAPAQFYGVHAEAVEHVVVQYRQLLLDVVYPHRLGGQAEVGPQARGGDGRDAGGPVTTEVDRYPVRLAVVQCGHYPVPALHICSLLLGVPSLLGVGPVASVRSRWRGQSSSHPRRRALWSHRP